MQGGTTFHFVTDGIESALQQAKDAAAGKDVLLGGGASAVQQYLAAALLDEMLISLAPVLLKGGERLFDNLGDATPAGTGRSGRGARRHASPLPHRIVG
jgi:dihydrofolate reductase